MAIRDQPIDPGMLTTFCVTETNDPMDLDIKSKVSDRLPALSRTYKYRLRDRALLGMKFSGAICSLASRESGSIVVSYGADRFAMEVSTDGDERDPLIITTMLRGAMSLLQDHEIATCSPCQGLIFRTKPGTRLLTSDNNARVNVLIKAAELENTLERFIGDRLRRPLEFAHLVDWDRGLAASLNSLIDFVMREFQRSDGVAANALALASLTDLLVSLILRALPHNYNNQMTIPATGVTPGYVRRAEEFMRVNAAVPIRMANVAEAAGCGISTLGAVFKKFRDTTPLRALQRIRLEQVHRELNLGVTDISIPAIARRYGFTNAGRFTAAYRRNFGETPTDTARRAGADDRRATHESNLYIIRNHHSGPPGASSPQPPKP